MVHSGLRLATRIGLLAVLLLASVAAYHFARAQVEAEVYRDRLAAAGEQYESLRTRYNRAVSRTAVTELRVHDGRVDVVVKNAAGEVEVIPTSLDPNREVYVDYVVLDGRLWIRRVFDSATPPDQGQTIDSRLVNIDWDEKHLVYGKATYRRLAEGRWVVTVTGDGSLGLARRDEADTQPVDLATAPPVADFDAEEEAMAAGDAIGAREVLQRVLGW